MYRLVSDVSMSDYRLQQLVSTKGKYWKARLFSTFIRDELLTRFNFVLFSGAGFTEGRAIETKAEAPGSLFVQKVQSVSK